jgi:hypothetical protein
MNTCETRAKTIGFTRGAIGRGSLRVFAIVLCAVAARPSAQHRIPT